MRLLMLSGTGWLGGALTHMAVEAGHEVTCLARGVTAQPPEGAAFVASDRDAPDAYRDVSGAGWDAVVDVARQPGQVRRAVAALAPRTDRYVFVSTCSVYAAHDTPGADESASVLPALESDADKDAENYGEAKVACERHVLAGFGAGRCCLVRPGLIGGPGDDSDRTGYWPWRFANPATEDGSVLVPDAPELPAQIIDVRDLAQWLLGICERRIAGVFNAVGQTVPLAAHLEVAREVAGHHGPLVPAGPQWLADHGVKPWAGERSLPLWLPLPEYAGFAARDASAALAAGLRLRPLAETLADTLAWELSRPSGSPRKAGLSDDGERELIASWRRR